ncbi:hypothetical protein [Actinomadura sp. NTSP31]|uniref:hypothetical protein n=1 Tax=Actinomadura sp. NTSP31 TaxID=1735447 RepID=UPI0035C1DD3C
MNTELTTDTRELLAALRDLLNVPEPADRGDRPKRNLQLQINLARVVGTLNALVSVDHPNVAVAVRMLREDLAEPLDYATQDETAGGAR